MAEPLLCARESTLYDSSTELGWHHLGKKNKSRGWFMVGSVVLLLMTGGILILGISIVSLNHKGSLKLPPKSKNMVLLISDGLGPASMTFARTYYQYLKNKPYDYQLPLDSMHVGQSRTRSSSSLVTDSAAGATAISCNIKTFNRAVAVDASKYPCGTLLESAKHVRHMLTGLVVTSRMTHATPAAFSSHVDDRDNENKIAIHQIGDNPLGRSVDLMFGGGYCYFLPKAHNESCRWDHRDLLKEAKDSFDWKTIHYGDREKFDQLSPADSDNILPAIHLFSPDHMAYSIDRNSSYEPSLSEMTDKALQILNDASQKSGKGFLLVIEGSRIDMAAHSNDATTHVHEIFEYQNTVDVVKKFIDQHSDTMMISTSDHETGGLSLGRQVTSYYPDYLWYPDVLARVKSSSINLAKMILSHGPLSPKYIINEILRDQLGVTDPTETELSLLMNTTNVKRLDSIISDMISTRAQLGWTTHGHSGVDVNLYAYGIGAEYLIGSHENTEVGQFIAALLDLDLEEITRRLNSHDPSYYWTDISEQGKMYNENLDHYHQNNTTLLSGPNTLSTQSEITK
ncbi:alkaline-phosphatase-like protein [Pilobolus umbonatus]|nr:alkaline-phosphatase-like protein [Pilobolus umbonatus]